MSCLLCTNWPGMCSQSGNVVTVLKTKCSEGIPHTLHRDSLAQYTEASKSGKGLACVFCNKKITHINGRQKISTALGDLLLAAQQKDLNAVQSILQKEEFSNYKEAFQYAAKRGNIEMLEAFLNHRISARYWREWRREACVSAVYGQQDHAVKVILDHASENLGISIEETESILEGILLAPAKEGSQIFDIFLDAGLLTPQLSKQYLLSLSYAFTVRPDLLQKLLDRYPFNQGTLQKAIVSLLGRPADTGAPLLKMMLEKLAAEPTFCFEQMNKIFQEVFPEYKIPFMQILADHIPAAYLQANQNNMVPGLKVWLLQQGKITHEETSFLQAMFSEGDSVDDLLDEFDFNEPPAKRPRRY